MKEYTLSKIDGCWDNIPFLEVGNVQWLSDADVSMMAQLGYDADNIYVHMLASEANIRAEHFGECEPVWEDSCMEFFFSFDAKRYFNFEINPNGVFFLGYGTCREDRLRLIADPSLFSIITNTTGDGWEIYYKIPLSFLRLFYTELKFEKGLVFKANLYKCGDLTDRPHYLSWKKINTINPDFHRPEYFGKMILG